MRPFTSSAKPEHVLAGEQRELQLAFEHAAVRIMKRERDLGHREIAADFGVHRDLLQAHRGISRRGNDELRPRDALDRDRRQILRAGRRRPA